MRHLLLLAVGFIWLAAPASAQFERKWLSAGDLHNWYSEVGTEIESGGFVGSQQDGMRWPGVYRYTDMQAWKGLWIGARNVRGTDGTQYDARVVHAGPRVSGSGEFFPVDFRMVSRYAPTPVYVDGILSESLAPMANDEVDPTIPADRMIVNKVNTLLGLTMERRILQFSQNYHDDYHVIEYTFTNTGNADGDAEIEFPNQTLTDVVIYPQWRLSVAKETRYVVGNASGWGINAMVDTWGDGADDNLPGAQPVRAHYSWHGYFPNKDVSYNNIGGPILPEAVPAVQIAASDTLGRLAAYQFAGISTLHASTSASNDADDPNQPFTTDWIDSDAPFQSNNDAFNPIKMDAEYKLMTKGHKVPSHAYVIEPGGLPNWITTTADPSLGSSGGFSAASGYGPYTLAPGESIRIVLAEAGAGLSREVARDVGRGYKENGANDDAPIAVNINGRTVSMTKNEWVFTGRDSLYQTFLRAQANYDAGYDIPRPPLPPSTFTVTSGGDRIQLEWEYPTGGSAPAGFNVYRATGSYDSTYTKIAELGPGELRYDDKTPVRGLSYYYYVTAEGDPVPSGGPAGTPAGVTLESSRYYTQTYVPARLKRQQGTALDEIRIVPNPFHLGAAEGVRWPAPEQDKLAFFNIPGKVRIDLYTELGELIDTIHHDDGSGDAFWTHTTSSRQVVASGLYIAVFTVTEDIDSEDGTRMFSRGERTFRKFVIIR